MAVRYIKVTLDNGKSTVATILDGVTQEQAIESINKKVPEGTTIVRMKQIERAGSADPKTLVEKRVGKSQWSEEQTASEISDWKTQALGTLRSVYKGDFDAFMSNVDAGKKLKGANREQEELYGIVNNINDAVDASDLAYRMQNLKETGNKFAPYVERMVLRKTWQPEQQTMVDAAGYAFFPNTALRMDDPDAGYPTKILGGIQDVFSLPARLMTGVTEKLSPKGGDLTWTEAIGRPDPYSTGGERFIDFTVSAPIPGKLIEKGVEFTGKAGAKLFPKVAEKVTEKMSNVPVIKSMISETPQQAVIGPYLTGAKPALEVAPWEQISVDGIKGAVQGLEYGAVPALFTATNPEEASPKAFSDGVTTLAMAPLFGGVLGGIGGAGRAAASKLRTTKDLTKWGDELTGGYRSFERMKKATQDMPLDDSRTGVQMIKDVDAAIESAITANATARNEAAKLSRPTWTPDIVAKTLPSLKEVPEELAVFPGQAATYQELIENVAKKYFSPSQLNKGDYTPTMEQLVQARTFLGKLLDKTTDPEKKFMAQSALHKVESYMDDLAGKSIIIPSSPPFNPNTPNVIGGFPMTRTTEVIDPQYEELRNLFNMKKKFVDPEGSEGVLRKFGQARLSPIDRSTELKDMVTAMEGIVAILNKNGIARPKNSDGIIPPGQWTMEDVDFITPAVAREIRKRMKFDGDTFGMLMSKLTDGISIFSPESMIYKLAKPPVSGIKTGIKIGTGIAPSMKSEYEDYNPFDEDNYSPFDENNYSPDMIEVPLYDSTGKK